MEGYTAEDDERLEAMKQSVRERDRQRNLHHLEAAIAHLEAITAPDLRVAYATAMLRNDLGKLRNDKA